MHAPRPGAPPHPWRRDSWPSVQERAVGLREGRHSAQLSRDPGIAAESAQSRPWGCRPLRTALRPVLWLLTGMATLGRLPLFCHLGVITVPPSQRWQPSSSQPWGWLKAISGLPLSHICRCLRNWPLSPPSCQGPTRKHHRQLVPPQLLLPMGTRNDLLTESHFTAEQTEAPGMALCQRI